MKCPLKFARYEFEGGEDCVGAECGFYGAVCRNDDSEPLSDVSAEDANANDGNATQDTREKINALRAHYGAGPTAMTDEQIAAGHEVYGAKKDADMVIVDELHDSREKLEEDVREWANAFNSALDDDYSEEVINAGHIAMIHCWLDRQAAITERKHLELACAFQLESDKRITELQAKVDELTIQLRASNAERERLRECLGIATDNAHDLLTLVDESGNVYDCDEGLA